MANRYGADVLASINRILQYNQQRERDKVAESLSMLQMAQQQKNLDRQFELNQSQLGIGDSEYAKYQRDILDLNKDKIEAELEFFKRQKEDYEEDRELKQKQTFAKIQNEISITKERQRKQAFESLDQKEDYFEQKLKENTQEFINSFELQATIDQASQSPETSASSLDLSTYLDNFINEKKGISRKQKNDYKLRLKQIAKSYALTGDVSDIHNFMQLIENASFKSQKGVKLNKKEQFWFNFFGQEGSNKFSQFSANKNIYKTMLNNINQERNEVTQGDFKFDINKISFSDLSESDRALIDDIIQNREDEDADLPPAYLGTKGYKDIQSRIIQSQDNLDRLRKLYNNAINSKNKTNQQIELIDNYGELKESIDSEIKIQKRVLKRIQKYL